MMEKWKRNCVAAALAGVLTLNPAGIQATESPIDLAKKLNQAFVEVADKAGKTVVVVKVSRQARARSSDMSRLREFFREYGEPRRDGERGRDQERDQERDDERERQRLPDARPYGQGSGVIIRKDGYILTNRHVVEGADEVEVIMRDGKTYPAKVRGMDEQSDLAVLKIEASNLPTAPFANSDKTRVGEYAIAIGAPLGLDFSVTVGHVSAKGRSMLMGNLRDSDFIQTDANINRGNSGGPLLNIDGKIIGINTLIRGADTGNPFQGFTHSGIAFAISSNLAKDISNMIIEHGEVVRAWLGVQIVSMRDAPELRQELDGPKEGVAVTSLQIGGPAAKSNLKVDDVITAVEGEKIYTTQDLRDAIRGKKIGAPVKMAVVRGGTNITVAVRPGKHPELEEINRYAFTDRRAPELMIGIRCETVTSRLADAYGVEASDGVIVTDVQADSLAAGARIEPGDVITELGGTKITDLQDFRAALRKANLESGVRVKLVNESGKKLRLLRSK